MSNINMPSAFADLQATVSSTAETLIDLGFTAQQVQDASVCHVIVNSESIRAWWSGSTPTTSEGALFTVGFKLYEEDIRNLEIIRNGATDSEVAIVLSRN